MPKRALLIRIFFVLFFLEAALSILGVLSAHFDLPLLPALEGLYGGISTMVLLGSVALYYGAALGWVTPRRIFAVPFVLGCVSSLASTFLSIEARDVLSLTKFLRASESPFQLYATQTSAMVVIALLSALKLTWGLSCWKEATTQSTRVELSLGGRLLYLGAFIFPVALALPLSLLFFGTHGIKTLSQGAIVSDLTHLYSVETVFQKENTQIVLIPMSHVAHASFYQDILQDHNRPGVLLLEEGVMDEKRLLQIKTGYARIAKATGLADQVNAFSPQDGWEATRKNADIDVQFFHPSSVTLLNELFAVYGGSGDTDSPSPILGALQQTHEREKYFRFFEDVLDQRNDHLLEQIDRHAPHHPVMVIPWGALHISAIARGLQDRGFVERESEKRVVLTYRLLWAHLRRHLAQERAADALLQQGSSKS
ncbi:MAG: hypothetical protein VX699_10110 [Myxococcota bacterium]|nr:hypothetical protein [Myxococcota bacterium]